MGLAVESIAPIDPKIEKTRVENEDRQWGHQWRWLSRL
jgi:hypothetical protein